MKKREEIIICTDKSFLLSSLFGILFTFTSWGFIGSLFFSGFSFGFQGSFLFLHNLFVLFNGLCVHLDGSVAQSTIISIPMLGHEDSWTTWWAGLSGLSDVTLAWISEKLPSTEYNERVSPGIFLWMCLFFFLVV